MQLKLPVRGRTLGLALVVLVLVAVFAWVGLRSGPLAPVPVTVARVESRAIAPGLYGIGTVQARYTYRIGPTYAGRLKRVDVNAGDSVQAGQVLGEMDPVDLDQRIQAQEAALRRAEAAQREAQARQTFARGQARRYRDLYAAEASSRELAEAKQQELQVADAAVSSSGSEAARLRAERSALQAQRSNLRLVAPVAGLVAARSADPGTTVVAGQAVLEVIDPASLWINTRFDQVHAGGLAAQLPARIVLRSRSGEPMEGVVQLVEPLADQVTEETLAKVVFRQVPTVLPPIGELAEVTVLLPQQPALPVIPNAAVRKLNAQTGVWVPDGNGVRFVPVRLGKADLDGRVQVLEGLKANDEVVVYSERALTERSRIKRVERIQGVRA